MGAYENPETFIDTQSGQHIRSLIEDTSESAASFIKQLGEKQKLEREKIKIDKVICEDYNVERWKIIKPEDEDGNNERPYCWYTFGATSFFGQEITHWMPIPK